MGAGCGIAYLAAARPGSKRAAVQRLRRTIGLPYPATRCSGVLSAEALAAAFPSRATVAGERASRSRRTSPKKSRRFRDAIGLLGPVSQRGGHLTWRTRVRRAHGALRRGALRGGAARRGLIARSGRRAGRPGVRGA